MKYILSFTLARSQIATAIKPHKIGNGHSVGAKTDDDVQEISKRKSEIPNGGSVNSVTRISPSTPHDNNEIPTAIHMFSRSGTRKD